jgi:hypothetical protein
VNADLINVLKTQGFAVEVFENNYFWQSYRKPVVIHCVAAFQEVIQIKSKWYHCAFDSWIKNKQVAEQLIANGFYLSFENIYFKNPLEFVFKAIPNDRFFFGDMLTKPFKRYIPWLNIKLHRSRTAGIDCYKLKLFLKK